jgi:hypothetical protein
MSFSATVRKRRSSLEQDRAILFARLPTARRDRQRTGMSEIIR